MKLLYILLLTACSSGAWAQKNILKNSTGEDAKSNAFRDSLLKYHPGLKSPFFGPDRPSIPTYKTPPADMSVIKIPLKGEYTRNNGKGANIYSMQPYNMPCLVPDSTFLSKMPIAGNFVPLENKLSLNHLKIRTVTAAAIRENKIKYITSLSFWQQEANGEMCGRYNQ